MKKILNLFVFLLVVSVLAFTSCKKVNNEPTIGGADVPSDIDGAFVGHEYVDLGLPSGTLWATCNVGAVLPCEYGNYFAWGETKAKSEYNMDNYKWCDNLHDLTKYNADPFFGYIDNKTVLDPGDDAAYINWGGNWRMPTYDQIKELIDECTWEWTSYVSVTKGYKVTGSNGKSIFLPAAGLYTESGLSNAGNIGHYWLSSLDGSNYAYILNFADSVYVNSNCQRYKGLSVRPVWRHKI